LTIAETIHSVDILGMKIITRPLRVHDNALLSFVREAVGDRIFTVGWRFEPLMGVFSVGSVIRAQNRQRLECNA